jgi:protein gp37
LSIEPLLEDLGEIDLTGIAWTIVGGESGPGARPMHAEWVRSIKKQCGRQKVPFFFKQWGGTRKAVAGRVLDGKTHSDFPSVIRSNRSGRTTSVDSWAAFVPVEALVG